MTQLARSLPSYRRGRRIRRSPALRRLVRETRLDPAMLVLPIFIDARLDEPAPIASLRGHMRWPVARAVDIARQAEAAGIGGLLLFGLPEMKDERGLGAVDPRGPVPLALRAIRAQIHGLALIADVCLCEYTSHGHCGLLLADGMIDNDATLPVLAEAACVYAAAGADLIAPSDMMDGRVDAIRRGLDLEGHGETAILSYAAKYASAFYGPFREAADCAPQFGDRAGYQLDGANGREALLELDADAAEGADMLMVKPAGPYLDVIAAARARSSLPLAAYQVSGEYASLVAASERGWLDLRSAGLESLIGIARAGADVIITYFALDAAEWLSGGPR